MKKFSSITVQLRRGCGQPLVALAGLLAGLAAVPAAQAQTGGVGIGTTTPAASAALDVTSTTKGFLPPRLTTAQRDAIASPAAGLTIFNTTAGSLNTWDGVKWTQTIVSLPATGLTFAYTGGPQTYTVPAGVTVLTVDMAGGSGGPRYNSSAGQGLGGRVQATLAVTPGQVLTIQVGGAGVSNAGGYNGGGGASSGDGGGGGASDIRLGGTALTNRVLVAGGGGGGGDVGAGGAGGDLTGATGGTNGNGGGGTGGSQTAAGLGGAAGSNSAGGNGSNDTGGSGNGYSGGGGGGYFGAGGGGGSAGGGGGSSFAGTGTSAVAHTQGYQSGNGYVRFTDNAPITATTPPVLDASNFVNTPWTKNGNNVFPTVFSSSVGIGTITPVAKLTVQPATNAEVGLRVTNGVADGAAISGNIVLQTLTGGDSGFSFLGFNGSNASGETRYSTSKNRWRLGTDQRSTGDVFFLDTYNGTTGAQVLAATATGNVGIGTTAPTQKLEVAGTVYSTAGGFMFPDGTTQTTAATGGGAAVTAGNGLTKTGNNVALGGSLTGATSIAQAGNNFSLTGGNVGIGTSSPAARFYVQAADNSTNPIATFQPLNLSQGVSLTYQGIAKTGTNATSDLTLDGKSTGNILLHTGGANGSTGNVGIGTSAAPSQKLEVAGNVQISGTGNGLKFPDGTTQTTAATGGGAGDNLGNHTATQALNMRNFVLTGTGDNIGTAVGVGVRADGGLNLGQNTTGNNIALGYAAGANTTGIQNTFLGYAAGSNTSGGFNNIFIGYATGNANSVGTRNTFVGTGSGNGNTTGSFNEFSGYQSGLISTTGSGNTFSGAGTGLLNLTGSNNTALGFNSGPATGALDNTMALGNGATVNVSNKIRLGNTAVTVIEGQVAYTFPSDARFKYDVQANVPGLAFIKALRPVTYRFDVAKLAAFDSTGTLSAGFTARRGAVVQTGFLAQEVEQAARRVGFVFDGVHAPANARDHYSLAYSQFVMPLVKAVQEQQAQLEAQQAQIAALQAQNAALQAKTAQAEATQTLLEADHASLLSLQAQMARLLGEGTQASAAPRK